MGSMVNLDTMVIWAPPAAADSERASQASQQRQFIFHREPSSRPSSTTASHISDEPIYISSDDESTFETDEPATCSGSEDMDDDSKSDDTLPSINTILTSVKKGSPDLCPIGSLFNDTNQPLSLDTGASRSGQEAATGADTPLPSTPTTAQASSAMQSHISGSPDCMELVASGDAVTTGHLPEMLEISYPPPTLSSGSEAQCESSENYEASNATATSLHHAIEQTRDETQRCGRLLGSCTEDCSVSQFVSHASSNSDDPMRQREEDGLISSNSLSVHEEEKEHHDSVIDDDFGQPLAPQCFISDLRQEGDISMPTAPSDHNSVSEARDTSSRKKRLYNYYLTHSRPDYNHSSNVGSDTVSQPQGQVPSDNPEIDKISDAVATRQLRRKGKRKNYSSPKQDVASHCDSDSDTSSSSRSEADVQDEDYGPSTSRGGRDDEADSSDLPPTRKRRKVGYQPSPDPIAVVHASPIIHMRQIHQDYTRRSMAPARSRRMAPLPQLMLKCQLQNMRNGLYKEPHSNAWP
ncbi:unnamed protein product [Clonostachys solani]|uniref:Uncharacterized protein n=1 Tax=Clonostachys solani TaxID=160281 RepID=A0A9P0EJX1_9HYPO|nr:unnamed protein product [Clonostachys solani]